MAIMIRDIRVGIDCSNYKTGEKSVYCLLVAIALHVKRTRHFQISEER